MRVDWDSRSENSAKQGFAEPIPIGNLEPPHIWRELNNGRIAAAGFIELQIDSWPVRESIIDANHPLDVSVGLAPCYRVGPCRSKNERWCARGKYRTEFKNDRLDTL